jgi:hypothetical protein
MMSASLVATPETGNARPATSFQYPGRRTTLQRQVSRWGVLALPRTPRRTAEWIVAKQMAIGVANGAKGSGVTRVVRMSPLVRDSRALSHV